MTTWWAVDVHPAQSQDSVAVAAWLVAHTNQALEERSDGALVATVQDEGAAGLLVQAAGRQWGERITVGQPRALEAVDWSTQWRAGLGPRRVGRLSIVPSWLMDEFDEDGPSLALDPESAFGSGEHGSTRAALFLLDRLLQPGDRVLDLGSGSGILTLAAIKLGAARAAGIDSDGDAIPVAQRNARRNDLTDTVAFVAGDAGALAPLLGPAELIVSNILRLANEALIPGILATLADGGCVIFSGMEVDEADDFRAALAAHRLVPVLETVDEGWWAVGAKRC
jgi:ribosomal protein L11 methyltransferase